MNWQQYVSIVAPVMILCLAAMWMMRPIPSPEQIKATQEAETAKEYSKLLMEMERKEAEAELNTQ